jgi:hypothetical protein
MQVRRAAESLRYNAGNLSEQQRDAIVKSLRDPQQSIFLASKHLSDLRNIDFPGMPGECLTLEDVRIVGSRYWHGPNVSLDGVKSNLSYGSRITERYGYLNYLLRSPPTTLEYSPVQNNIVKPFNQSMDSADRQIRQLYGSPF